MRLQRLTSNKKEFKPVTFHEGLNLVVADRNDKSQDTDSRNGVGKTTLMQIIDYCLAGRVLEGDSLEKLLGDDWEFALEISHIDQSVTVLRSLDDSTKISVAGDTNLLLGGEKSPAKSLPVTLKELKAGLGMLMFGLDQPSTDVKNSPSFRSLFTHVSRWRGNAFSGPFEAFSRERTWQVQVNNAFLLGLNWRLASEREQLRERDRTLKLLGKIEEEDMSRELARLDSELIVLRGQERRLDQQLENFTVLDEYQEVEARANLSTKRMQDLSNDQTMAARLIELYQQELTEQVAVSIDFVRSMFEEVEVLIPDSVVRSLEEIEAFHSLITRNRQSYLESEVRRLEEDQSDRQQELHTLEGSRSADLQLLNASGALEELTILQKRNAETAAEIRELLARTTRLRELRSGRTTYRRDLNELEDRTALDLDERRANVAGVIEEFNSIFEGLYADRAILVIDSTANGYVFETSLPRQGSHGVDKVAIFSYDFAVAARSSTTVPMLIHDSLIFDGVDERQKAKAIKHAMETAASSGFQYLLALNSDDIPVEELEHLDVDITESVMLRLTDEDDRSGLLGRRY